jgi:hypothetical protein
MLTQGAGDLFRGLDTGAHGLAAPFVEELAGRSGRVALPELLKGFLQKVSADSLQVVTEQFAPPEALFDLQILLAPQQQSARFLSTGLRSSEAMRRDSPARTTIQSLVHLSRNVEPVEDRWAAGDML